MELRLQRIWLTENSTIGQLYLGGVTQAFTLELPWRDNHPFLSCIPAGTYDVKLTFSPHLKRVTPEIMDVPDRTDIRIHWANLPDQLLGCVAVGQSRGTDEVLHSVDAFNELFPQLQAASDAGEAISITIVDAAEWVAP